MTTSKTQQDQVQYDLYMALAALEEGSGALGGIPEGHLYTSLMGCEASRWDPVRYIGEKMGLFTIKGHLVKLTAKGAGAAKAISDALTASQAVKKQVLDAQNKKGTK